MGNFITKLKRFISNKNTVTILCILAGIVVLYIGYNYRINSKINPVKVPYAKVALESRHVITAEDIGYIEVNSDVVKRATNLVQDVKQLIGKEVTYGNVIAKNSFFYNEDITDPSLSPDYVLNDIEDGYTAFSLTVDSASTYGNSIHKSDYIDLWFKGEDDTEKIIYATLVESIKVLDVRDNLGVSLENSETKKPSELLFAVPDNLYSLLVKAQSVGSLEAVPRNKAYTANPGETKVASEYVQNFILSKSATIPDEVVSDTPSVEETNSAKNEFKTAFNNLLNSAKEAALDDVENGVLTNNSTKCYSYDDLVNGNYLTRLDGYNGSVLVTYQNNQAVVSGWYSNGNYIIEDADENVSVDGILDANNRVASTTCE